MNNRNDVPGYGYQLAKGATALTESWPALEEVSNNHLMLGHIMEWFFNGLAGIQQSESSVAYRDIVIKPELVGDLTSVKGSYHTSYGYIGSEWYKKEDKTVFQITIPPNTKATLKLPASHTQLIKEGKNIKIPTRYENGRAIIPVNSGSYIYTIATP